MGYIDHIRECNRWNPRDFIPFLVDGERVGMVRPAFAEHLGAWPNLFHVAPDALTLVGTLTGFEERSRAVQQVLRKLEEQGVIGYLHGEKYPVTVGNRQQVKFLVDRACAPSLGIRAFGQHLNGFVRANARLSIWVGRRSASKRLFPLKLDHLVAGGLPYGISLTDNLIKECREEADIEPELAAKAVPVGAVTYCRDSERGLKPDVIYCYDLELPSDFQPRCTDGEVEEFYLWPVEQVLETVRDTDEFKINCNLVIIDFLVRHGYISQDEPDYLDMVSGLRPPLP